MSSLFNSKWPTGFKQSDERDKTMKAAIPLAIFSAAVALITIPLISFSQTSGWAERPDAAQVARGAQAWRDECARCHNLRSPSELNDEDWIVSTTHMRVRGNIPGDRVRDIQAFLRASNKKE